jgi:hypothetical protein
MYSIIVYHYCTKLSFSPVKNSGLAARDLLTLTFLLVIGLFGARNGDLLDLGILTLGDLILDQSPGIRPACSVGEWIQICSSLLMMDEIGLGT